MSKPMQIALSAVLGAVALYGARSCYCTTRDLAYELKWLDRPAVAKANTTHAPPPAPTAPNKDAGVHPPPGQASGLCAGTTRRKDGNGRSEPQLEGLFGYVVASPDERGDKVLWRKEWRVHSLTQKGPNSWAPEGPYIKHKTAVKVVRQSLNHQGFGSYSGQLEVEVSGGEFAVVDLQAFALQPYWACPMRVRGLAATGEWHSRGGMIVATIDGDATPVSRTGEWVPMKKGEHLLCNADPHMSPTLNRAAVECDVLDPKDRRREYSVEVPVDALAVIQ
jgi:hypothetical protein